MKYLKKYSIEQEKQQDTPDEPNLIFQHSD